MQQSEQDAQTQTQMGAAQLPGPVFYGRPYQIPLARMFNYEQAYWMDMVKKWGLRGLEEELDAYGIIDVHVRSDSGPEEVNLYP